MVKKRLADLLQEEAEKFTPAEGESAIEVAAEEVAEENVSATEESPAQTPEPTSTRRTNPTKADLEVTVKELTETLEKSRRKEATLEQQIIDLQSKLFEQQELAERLTKELYETKKTALQLAEANSQLIEEINASKQVTEAKSKLVVEEINASKQVTEAKSKLVAQETSALKPVKENYNPINYRKSHRSSEKLAQNQPDESADNANPMWLLD